ncbi:hypothetical protein AB6D04_02915 [Vibrio splendidus]|uniref:hypothetical protein n=1 Tax=Vibrio splendidus TaxID=29497 RepID=UPI000C8675DD|nr:hypothetical protein [Vibrio splendidus]PMN74827.1 hypothetical protein BCT24_07250 [Vibrio splendidus]
MKFLKVIITIVVVYNIASWVFDKTKKEEWMSFVYPNANNLTIDRFGGTFSSLSACRAASLDILEDLNATNYGDYECALNCDISGGKPYICDETSR